MVIPKLFSRLTKLAYDTWIRADFGLRKYHPYSHCRSPFPNDKLLIRCHFSISGLAFCLLRTQIACVLYLDIT
jgi:hypothetical protein